MKLHCYKFIFPLLLLFILSCQNEQKCQYNPEPVFNPEWTTISNHSFDREGIHATEKVTFQDGVRLELFQTICNNTKQEYHFHLVGDLKNQPEGFWIAETANQFYKMASVGKEVEGIAQWAMVIQQQAETFTLGEKKEIQDGISIKIDKLLGTSDAELIITIAQEVE